MAIIPIKLKIAKKLMDNNKIIYEDATCPTNLLYRKARQHLTPTSLLTFNNPNT